MIEDNKPHKPLIRTTEGIKRLEKKSTKKYSSTKVVVLSIILIVVWIFRLNGLF